MICPKAACPAMLRCRLAFGGGARLDYWLQALANVLDRPLVVNSNAEHAATLGAAPNDSSIPDGEYGTGPHKAA